MVAEKKSWFLRWLGVIGIIVTLAIAGLSLSASWGSNETRLTRAEADVAEGKEERKELRKVDTKQGENIARILAILENLQKDIAQIKRDVKK